MREQLRIYILLIQVVCFLEKIKRMELNIMNKKLMAAAVMCSLMSTTAFAANPIPTFDKEAVTTHPFNRTGQQEQPVKEMQGAGEFYKPGNTGTEANPAFFVAKVKLTGFTLPDKSGKLAAICKEYEGRSLQMAELQQLISRINEYARTCGYTVAQAIVPPQEVKQGELEITVYVAKYDDIEIISNESDVADRVLAGYIHKNLQSGAYIMDKPLEMTMNNINDLPGVVARAILAPGSKPGTTKVQVQVLRRPVWNNYVFTDNAGGYYSGRYRYGFNTEINNPGHQGDKIILNGMLTNHDTKNYGARYEAPVGRDGTRWGIGWSQSSYDFYTNSSFNSLGQSRGFSFYGLTPVYRDRMNRVTAIYGYDHRKIKDRLQLKAAGLAGIELTTETMANVYHAGISGSKYLPNRFSQYSLIYWYGKLSGGGKSIDGDYHKLTSDLLHVIYDGKTNYRVQLSGQIANRNLDGSEMFYLGGMNGVRAYGASEGSGDIGFTATAEVRRQTGIKGLEAAAFIDTGAVKSHNAALIEHLSGWGVGLRYNLDNSWHAQLDYARKINAQRDRVEPRDHSGHMWFQLYKMF